MIDNYGLWEQHEWRQEEKLEKLPVCDYCGEPIQDESYHEIMGENICDCCLDGMRKYVEV